MRPEDCPNFIRTISSLKQVVNKYCVLHYAHTYLVIPWSEINEMEFLEKILVEYSISK